VTPIGRQSERLHRDLPQSEFIALLGLGHMVHHLDPEAVASAVERAAEKAGAAL
jgi:pimeloyl-ACP methyl ester carboxylesterase